MSAELYCSSCEHWSPESAWIEDDVFVDGDPVESYVECPRCGHHYPPYDPKRREPSELQEVVLLWDHSRAEKGDGPTLIDIYATEDLACAAAEEDGLELNVDVFTDKREVKQS